MNLPPALEAWRIWLSLCPPDLLESIGQLILRLQPMVGRSSSARRQKEQIGVGDIVRRGSYERMLLSEWAMADAVPDEFLRRAANNELLFTGPEAENAHGSKLFLALFDAGPSQLGEPRLAHLALFILLARRAQDAGAQFLWGVLQEPGKLYEDLDLHGLKKLMQARTLQAVQEKHLTKWNEALATQAIGDCWQIGLQTSQAAKLQGVTTMVSIQQSLLKPELQLQFLQQHSKREIQLPLPAKELAIRIMRAPFSPLAPPSKESDKSTLTNNGYLPQFCTAAERIMLVQDKNNITALHIPRHLNSAPGLPRNFKFPEGSFLLGVCLIKKRFAYVSAEADRLIFAGFDGALCKLTHKVMRPVVAALPLDADAVPLLPLFFQSSKQQSSMRERIFILDLQQKLLCWEYVGTKKVTDVQKLPNFVVAASNVIGIVQFEQAIVYACIENGQIQNYVWHVQDAAPKKDVALVYSGLRFLHGIYPYTVANHAFGQATYAVQINATNWILPEGMTSNTADEQGTKNYQLAIKNIKCINPEQNPVSSSGSQQAGLSIEENAQVIAVLCVARLHISKNMNAQQRQKMGLIVLHPDKKRIQFRTQNEVHEVLQSPSEILHFAFDSRTHRLALQTNSPSTISVYDLALEKPLLQRSFTGDEDAQ